MFSEPINIDTFIDIIITRGARELMPNEYLEDIAIGEGRIKIYAGPYSNKPVFIDISFSVITPFVYREHLKDLGMAYLFLNEDMIQK